MLGYLLDQPRQSINYVVVGVMIDLNITVPDCCTDISILLCLFLDRTSLRLFIDTVQRVNSLTIGTSATHSVFVAADVVPTILINFKLLLCLPPGLISLKLGVTFPLPVIFLIQVRDVTSCLINRCVVRVIFGWGILYLMDRFLELRDRPCW